MTAPVPHALTSGPTTIKSGRESWLDDAAATPRQRVRVLLPGTMEGTMDGPLTGRGVLPLRRRRHVDLCRSVTTACPR
ncbi:hypothetical protein NUM3379_21150 [Kineococcus sp. NUM-3379]